ncbi:single-stranded-DNA-specific exonuclease RecJ [Pseudenhygromyxa sp. WMMC2535]|uniref:single-stranded-DNA-specific exonuclease RecJ n=1 Tax=Pseudenhygromyxa sp. WMMC2535 TaxID=2712867 RepID=UPI0015522504|nr:single-stranded-DNA-specific exonuclease RecJ [Pseudenhygromyxa sp. WMMC2535]NVB41472.1 single-stranded-DNA-specific exonuclease RecJ [Pseudenhygromyxa sp. WMMC2535]
MAEAAAAASEEDLAAFEEPPRAHVRGALGRWTRAQLHERAEELDVHPVVVELLVGREIEDLEAQRRFLSPRLGELTRPDSMAGYEAAVDLLTTARQRRWRVGVFGDYDVDGVTTTTILTTFLERLGVEIVAKVASREGGYGFGLEPAKALHEAGVDLVLTGDCGTSDHEALEWLRARDVPTVVIDHHQVPETMPPATALINPHQSGCDFPFKGLCSAGVGFYLAAGVRTALAKAEPSARENLPDPRAWLDLVALGTVCDMMPLVEDNRILVRHGLELMGQRRRPGVRELLRRARVEEGVSVDEGTLGFVMGPRINAPGRLGSAEPSLELLRARSPTEAEPLAARVEMFNSQRRSLQDKIVGEALALLAADPKSPRRSGLVVAREAWAPGIVGIAASGIVERYRRPTLVIGVDAGSGEARGSARSAAGVDVRAALAECGDLLRRFGGHKAAAGVSLDPANLPALVERFDRACAEQLGEEAGRDPIDEHDGELALEDIDLEYIAAIESLGPFGVGFPRPRYLCAGAKVVSTRIIKDRHLALVLAQGKARRDAIAFRQAGLPIARGDEIGLLFTPERNTFRGYDRVQLIVQRAWRA